MIANGELKKNGWARFAHGYARLYLKRCNAESKSDDEIDIEIFSKLVRLDTNLGTTVSEQLSWCLELTTRSDIIKVNFLFEYTNLNNSRASISNRSTIVQRWRKMDSVDSYIDTCSDMLKNQSQMIKLILKFIRSLFNWI